MEEVVAIVKPEVKSRKAEHVALVADIEATSKQLREKRDKAKADGMAWRDDADIMATVFRLMTLKYAHPEYRYETVPENASPLVTIKLRWKVVGAAGGAEVLQVSKHVVQLSGAEVLAIVAAHTAKKCPHLSPFASVALLGDKATNLKVPVTPDAMYCLNVTFPGPKFEMERLIRLECVNKEWETWTAGKAERKAKHDAAMAEAQANAKRRKELLEQAAKDAKDANKPVKGAAKKGAAKKGVGRGRGAVPPKPARARRGGNK